MNLRTTIVSLAAAATLLGTAVLGTAAQSTATSSVTIGGGNFTASLSATNFGNLPYSFNDQYARNGNIALVVTDMTGDASGWQVTVDITDFIGDTRPTESIPSENLEITGYSVTLGADGSQPYSAANMPVSYVEADPELTWTAQPGYGQGSYILTMTGDLLVPGLTTAQTYTSTGTVSIVSGP